MHQSSKTLTVDRDVTLYAGSTRVAPFTQPHAVQCHPVTLDLPPQGRSTLCHGWPWLWQQWKWPLKNNADRIPHSSPPSQHHGIILQDSCLFLPVPSSVNTEGSIICTLAHFLKLKWKVCKCSPYKSIYFAVVFSLKAADIVMSLPAVQYSENCELMLTFWKPHLSSHTWKFIVSYFHVSDHCKLPLQQNRMFWLIFKSGATVLWLFFIEMSAICPFTSPPLFF